MDQKTRKKMGTTGVFPIDLMEVRIVDHKQKYKDSWAKEILRYGELEAKLLTYLCVDDDDSKAVDRVILQSELLIAKKVCFLCGCFIVNNIVVVGK